jgi:hypothetical protein
MIEGSGSGPLTNGSGRLKNTVLKGTGYRKGYHLQRTLPYQSNGILYDTKKNLLDNFRLGQECRPILVFDLDLDVQEVARGLQLMEVTSLGVVYILLLPSPLIIIQLQFFTKTLKVVGTW